MTFDEFATLLPPRVVGYAHSVDYLLKELRRQKLPIAETSTASPLPSGDPTRHSVVDSGVQTVVSRSGRRRVLDPFHERAGGPRGRRPRSGERRRARSRPPRVERSRRSGRPGFPRRTTRSSPAPTSASVVVSGIETPVFRSSGVRGGIRSDNRWRSRRQSPDRRRKVHGVACAR